MKLGITPGEKSRLSLRLWWIDWQRRVVSCAEQQRSRLGCRFVDDICAVKAVEARGGIGPQNIATLRRTKSEC